MMDAAGSSLDALQLFRTTVASTLSHSVEKFVELALEELKKLQVNTVAAVCSFFAAGRGFLDITQNDMNTDLLPWR